MSQKTKILKCLKMSGKITPIDALRNYGCYRLAARVGELRKEGYDIKSVMVERRGKRFAEYELQPGN